MSEAGQGLAPLRNRDFLLLWLANGLWWQAMFTEQVVFGWLALDLTNSAWWVALLGFFRSIPMLFLGPFSAAITDRFERRALILGAQFCGVAGYALLLLLFWRGELAYWHLALVALANGICWSVDWPTRRSIVPDLVGKGLVVEAMMLENIIQSLTRVVGPLAAGSLLATIGSGGGLLALAGMVGLGGVLVAGLRLRSRSPAPFQAPRSSWAQIGEGLRYVRGQPRIWGVVLITAIMNAWAFPFQGLLPVFARDVLGQGPLGLGLLGAANGAGSLVGLLWVKQSRGRWSNEWLFGGGSALACAGLVGFACSSSFPLSLALLVVSGVGQAGFSVMQSAITLVEATDQMRSRAMGAVVVAIGTGPLGRLASGALAASAGSPLAVGLMAAGALLATAGTLALLPGFARPRPQH
ncbi:MAG: MFS transporter [Candidatus Handelsmanbacteria bacterium]|nr:MFS transporter [Candidatus Handelsmanbacteria bacterium]